MTNLKPIEEYNKRWRDKFLHFMNISTYDEFLDLWLDLDATFIKLDKILKKIDDFCVVQAEFNKKVAERLHMDNEADMNNKDRNMYG